MLIWINCPNILAHAFIKRHNYEPKSINEVAYYDAKLSQLRSHVTQESLRAQINEPSHWQGEPLTHACSLKYVAHLSFQLERLNIL